MKPGSRYSIIPTNDVQVLTVVSSASRNKIYCGFHKTFEWQFVKVVVNSQSSLRTWEFHYVAVSQMANFEMNLGILRWEFVEDCCGYPTVVLTTEHSSQKCIVCASC